MRHFRLKVRGKEKLYVVVMIFRTRKIMNTFSTTLEKESMAFVRTWQKGKVVADVFLNRQNLDIGTISHEMVHVASGIMARREKNNVIMTCGRATKREEELAGLVGQLTNLVYKATRR